MVFRHSSITDAYTCYKKYDLKHNQGRKDDAKSGDMLFGTGIHLGLSTELEGGNGLSQFNTFWDTINPEEYTWGRFGHEELKVQAEQFLTRFVRLHKKKYKPYKIEESFEVDVNGFKVTGTPDVVGDYDGVPSIIDFKTSSYAYDKRKLLVSEQMPLYAYAAKKVWGYEAKQLVYPVFIKGDVRIQVISIDLTDNIVKGAIDNLTLMMQDLSTRTQWPMNRNACLNCPFWKECYGD